MRCERRRTSAINGRHGETEESETEERRRGCRSRGEMPPYFYVYEARLLTVEIRSDLFAPPRFKGQNNLAIPAGRHISGLDGLLRNNAVCMKPNCVEVVQPSVDTASLLQRRQTRIHRRSSQRSLFADLLPFPPPILVNILQLEGSTPPALREQAGLGRNASFARSHTSSAMNCARLQQRPRYPD